MFVTIAHCTTAYYYLHVLRHVAGMRATVADAENRVIQDFLDLRPKFFTMWGLAAQFLLFVLCVVHDLTRVFPVSSPVRRAARSARDLVMVALAGPIAVTVSFMFWSLFWTDRELVMPAVLDGAVPAWLNHSMHSVVVVLVVTQLLAEPHQPPSLYTAVAVAVALSGAYMYTLFNEYATAGRWIYPVFAKLDWVGRGALIGFNMALFLGLVILFRAAVQARWGAATDYTKTMKTRKD